VIRFGTVDVDVPAREVRRDGELIHLEPQAFDLLVLLIEHRDRVVPKSDLLDGVWGHRFVSESNITTRIKEIRRAVGDDGTRQHTIQNVRGRGYRFVAEVHDHDSPRASTSAPELVGRDREVSLVLDAVARSSVVTLTGPGGVGKSTLARDVARRMHGRYADGINVVELSTIAGGEPVLSFLARAVDVVIDVDRPWAAARAIAELDMLLVLDNCEHVVDDVAEVLDRILATVGARIRVLATSQVRLGLASEQVLGLGPIALDDAYALFVDRARAARPALDMVPIDRERVSVVLEALDRLPLTIEMAAARLSSMTFDELEAAIGDGAEVPPMTHRSPQRRHRSLESLVEWSAELLDPRHRRLFVDFSVFSGAVEARDVAQVIGSADVVSVSFDLAALVERSLLVQDDDGSTTWYRMLATVRSVAARWLEETGRADEVRRRHLRHFADVAWAVDQQIRTPDEARGRTRLDKVAAELRAAHSWARRHEPRAAAALSGALHLATYSTFWNEPDEWSRALLAAEPEPHDESLAGALVLVAGALANSGDLDTARHRATIALKSADDRIRVAALEILADVAIYAGEFHAAVQFADELLALGTRLDDAHSVGMGAVDGALALTYGGESVAASRRLDDVPMEALSHSDAAWVAYARGEALSAMSDPSATTHYREAVRRAAMIGNPFVSSVTRMALAIEYGRSGDHEQALDAYSVCLRDCARHGNFVHAVTTLRNLVEVFVAIGETRGAVVIASATSNDSVRPSGGAESQQLATVLGGLEADVDEDLLREWTDEGRRLDVPAAVRAAADIVDDRRGTHDPQVVLRQSTSGR
jgi:predicted ATPase